MTIVLNFVAPVLMPFGILLTLFMFYFFRDPERLPPKQSGVFIAPADGKVIVVRKHVENEHLHRQVWMVSIFMSPFNVHVNRSPCDGVVKDVIYTKGKFLSAFKEDAAFVNENIAMILQTPFGDIVVKQVAGFVARRAVCRVKKGDTLQAGQRYGIIKFSSRVDLYLPLNSEICVKVGDKVLAGESVIAKFS